VLLVSSLVVDMDDRDIDTDTPHKRRDVIWRDPDPMRVNPQFEHMRTIRRYRKWIVEPAFEIVVLVKVKVY